MPKSTEANNNFPYYGLDPAEFPYYEEMLISFANGASHFAPELMDVIVRYWSFVVEAYGSLNQEDYHLYEVVNGRINGREDVSNFAPEILRDAHTYDIYHSVQESLASREGNEQESAVVALDDFDGNGWFSGIFDGISFSALSDSVRSVGELADPDSMIFFALSEMSTVGNESVDADEEGELDYLYNVPSTNAETPEDNAPGKTSKDQQNVPESFEVNSADNDPEFSACATVVGIGSAEGPMGRAFLAE